MSSSVVHMPLPSSAVRPWHSKLSDCSIVGVRRLANCARLAAEFGGHRSPGLTYLGKRIELDSPDASLGSQDTSLGLPDTSLGLQDTSLGARINALGSASCQPKSCDHPTENRRSPNPGPPSNSLDFAHHLAGFDELLAGFAEQVAGFAEHVAGFSKQVTGFRQLPPRDRSSRRWARRSARWIRHAGRWIERPAYADRRIGSLGCATWLPRMADLLVVSAPLLADPEDRRSVVENQGELSPTGRAERSSTRRAHLLGEDAPSTLAALRAPRAATHVRLAPLRRPTSTTARRVLGPPQQPTNLIPAELHLLPPLRPTPH